MKNIIAMGLKKYFLLRAFKYKTWKYNAKDTQKLLLQSLVQNACETQYGQKYNFNRIVSYDTFCTQLPVVRYEDLAEYIEKIMNGASNILWPGSIYFFSRSSGTTNDVSKYIPVSDQSLHRNNYRAGKDIYTIFFENYPESQLFRNQGLMLGLGGSINTKNKISIGDISAILMSQLPTWAEKYREPSLRVALMKEWEKKIPAIIYDITDKNITHLSGVPTWFVSLFDNLLEKESASSIHELFPKIELFIHGAVSFEPYRAIFARFFPKKEMKYMEVYNASEGFFAIQDNPNKPGEMLLLTDHGVFYEFISLDDYFAGNMNAIPLWEVRENIDYALVITTNAGLWRYDIGDTVQFTSLDPYRIKITGRTKHFINLFGEELMVGNTDMALAKVCKHYNVVIENYTIGPIFPDLHGKGGHEWIIEWKGKKPPYQDFILSLDQELQKINSDYAAKRQSDIALQLPKIHFVKEGTFMKWMKKRNKLGAQNKVPRLSQKRTHLKEILSIQ